MESGRVCGADQREQAAWCSAVQWLDATLQSCLCKAHCLQATHAEAVARIDRSDAAHRATRAESGAVAANAHRVQMRERTQQLDAAGVARATAALSRAAPGCIGKRLRQRLQQLRPKIEPEPPSAEHSIAPADHESRAQELKHRVRISRYESYAQSAAGQRCNCSRCMLRRRTTFFTNAHIPARTRLSCK